MTDDKRRILHTPTVHLAGLLTHLSTQTEHRRRPRRYNHHAISQKPQSQAVSVAGSAINVLNPLTLRSPFLHRAHFHSHIRDIHHCA